MTLCCIRYINSVPQRAGGCNRVQAVRPSENGGRLLVAAGPTLDLYELSQTRPGNSWCRVCRWDETQDPAYNSIDYLITAVSFGSNDSSILVTLRSGHLWYFPIHSVRRPH